MRVIKDGGLVRFIPAGAGNTPTPRGGSVFCPVYPRWRGEHFIAQMGHESGGGLSPLARGTHINVHDDLVA